MKFRHFIILNIFLFFSNQLSAQNSFYKRMEGVLGGQPVQLHVTKEDSELTVLYYYQIIGLPVKLTGIVEKDGNFRLENFDDSGNVFETYVGGFTDDFTEVAGMWYNFDSTVNTTFAFKEAYMPTSRKFDIKTIRYKHYNDSNRLLAQYKNRQLYMSGAENTLAQKAVNDTVIKWQYGILPSFAGQKPRRIDFEKYGKFFIDSSKYEAGKMEAEKGFFITYTINSSAGVVFNEENLACIELYNYMFVGGMHPSEFISYHCFNTQTGKAVSLADMFKGDYKKALTRQADKVLRIRYDIKKKNLKRAGFNMKKIALNDNFYLTPQGIIFYYNEYDLGSYALGGIPVFISYESVRSYIREDGVLNWATFVN